MPDFIDDIIEREGGSTVTNDPADKGGHTQYGVSEKSNPEAWTDGKVTAEEARAIFEAKYIKGPGLDKIQDEQLREQLADYSVNSGPYVAIQALQRVVGAEIDGVLGPETLGLVNGAPDASQVGNQVAIERLKMFARIVKKDPSQARFILGWISRACEFIS